MLDAEQTEFGEFYTPRWVVKHIVDTNIERTLENDEIELSQLKLLDPACGAGNFLVYALINCCHYMMKNIQNGKRKRK